MALKVNYKYKLKYNNDRISNDMEFNSYFPEISPVVIEEKTFIDTYAKVVSISGNKDLLTVTIAIFKDDSKGFVIDKFTFSFTPSENENSVRWDKQAYEYAKSLPEFLDAVDC